MFSCLILNLSNKSNEGLLDNGFKNLQTTLRILKSQSIISGKTLKIIFLETFDGDEGESIREKYPNKTVVALMDDIPIDSLDYYINNINESIHVEYSSRPEVSFYPDGTSDVFNLVVISKSDLDKRRLRLEIGEFFVRITN
jgi:hypothetical protein